MKLLAKTCLERVGVSPHRSRDAVLPRADVAAETISPPFDGFETAQEVARNDIHIAARVYQGDDCGA